MIVYARHFCVVPTRNSLHLCLYKYTEGKLNDIYIKFKELPHAFWGYIDI
jgi:hypothetical protein